MLKAVIAACVALGLLGAAMLLSTQDSAWRLPDRYNPWAPLQIEAAPNLLTRYKLARLQSDPVACLATLAQSGFAFEALSDRETAPGCGWHNAVRISRSTLRLNAPFTLTCPAAVSLALWEHHTVQPAAERLLDSPVVRLVHLGSYACRNVYGREAGRRSEHAEANALDVAAFELQNGTRISVARDWAGPGARASFLRSVHAGACDSFAAVYGPDYNAAHADHFHLDRGPYRLCR